jgi:hypothetical protein
MANTTKPLIHTEIKQAKPKAKECHIVDSGRLALRVKLNRMEFWHFNYSKPM